MVMYAPSLSKTMIIDIPRHDIFIVNMSVKLFV